MYFKKNSIFKSFLFGLILILPSIGGAQIGNTNYPVSITPVLFPPFPSSIQFLNTAQTPVLNITITNKSSNASIQNVLLGVTVQTNSFLAQTRSLNQAQQFTLIGNTPLQLSNLDFSSLYSFANLTGITQAQYSAPFPQSTITFGFVVYDAITRVQLSNVNTYQVTYSINNPPTLQLPLDRASIVEQGVQNISFQWMPRQSNAPGSVEYFLQLIQVLDTNINPQQFFAGNPRLLFEGSTIATNFVYNALHPPLIPNQTYAWRVQARPVDYGGFTSTNFLEGGNSPVRTFKYVEACKVPIITSLENTSNNATVSWNSFTSSQTFIVSYKPQNQMQWIDVVVPRSNISNSMVIPNLSQGVTYNIKVKGLCFGGNIVESVASNFSTTSANSTIVTTPTIPSNPSNENTPSRAAINASCGAVPAKIDLKSTLLSDLKVNDRFTSNDFEITIETVSGSNGRFSGTGVAQVWLHGKTFNVRVRFNSITINTDKRVTAGEIITTN
ncbi:MAG: fibronectin type III domain-containing protein [Chitinophagaceae bacterium]|nr:fibronectin type III domain-containing protein [Chitinophagaceae bacterium]